MYAYKDVIFEVIAVNLSSAKFLILKILLENFGVYQLELNFNTINNSQQSNIQNLVC